MRELETQLRQKESDIAKLVQEVKAQEKIIKNQEKALTSQLSEESAANAYLKEVKQLRQKIRDLEEKDRQKEKQSQKKHEYYLQIEDKYREMIKDSAETAKINLKSPGFRQIKTSKSVTAKPDQFFKARSQSKQPLPAQNTPIVSFFWKQELSWFRFKLTEEKFRELQNTIKILKKALITNQGRTNMEREQFKTKSLETDKKIKELTDRLKEKERVTPIKQLRADSIRFLSRKITSWMWDSTKWREC